MKGKYVILVALRYLKHRKFATAVSILAIALSLLAVVGLGVVNFAVKKTAVEGSIRYPLIVGPEGASGVQLIMSTMFFIDKPSGIIPFSVYKELEQDKRVLKAYPIAMADTYKNVRIIGTNEEFVNSFGVKLVSGKVDFSDLHNAVFGFAAARRTGVKIGDEFQGYHGMVGGGAHHHDFTYKVAAIMEPTGRPEDSAIYTNYETVWKIHEHGHDHHGHHKKHTGHKQHEDVDHEELAIHAELAIEPVAEEQQEEQHAENEYTTGHTEKPHHGEVEKTHEDHHHVTETEHDENHQDKHQKHDKYHLSKDRLTAVIVKTGNPVYTGQLEREYSLKDGTLAVDTGKSIRDFVSHVNKGEIFIEIMSVGMLAIAMIMILVTLVMSLNERRKDLALMRSLGIGRLTIATTVMIEALIITLSGVALGILLGHLLIFTMQGAIMDVIGVEAEPFTITKMEMFGVVATLIVGQILAFVSMVWTYRLNLVEEIARD